MRYWDKQDHVPALMKLLVSWWRKTAGEQMDQVVSGHYWCTKENGTEALGREGTG